MERKILHFGVLTVPGVLEVTKGKNKFGMETMALRHDTYVTVVNPNLVCAPSFDCSRQMHIFSNLGFVPTCIAIKNGECSVMGVGHNRGVALYSLTNMRLEGRIDGDSVSKVCFIGKKCIAVNHQGFLLISEPASPKFQKTDIELKGKLIVPSHTEVARVAAIEEGFLKVWSLENGREEIKISDVVRARFTEDNSGNMFVVRDINGAQSKWLYDFQKGLPQKLELRPKFQELCISSDRITVVYSENGEVKWRFQPHESRMVEKVFFWQAMPQWVLPVTISRSNVLTAWRTLEY